MTDGCSRCIRRYEPEGTRPASASHIVRQSPALYGQAKYRGRRETRKPEEDDIDAFLRLAVGLDRDASLTQVLLDLRKKVEAVVTDPFLSDSSWRVWDEHEVLDHQKRLAMAVGTPRNKTLLHRL